MKKQLTGRVKEIEPGKWGVYVNLGWNEAGQKYDRKSQTFYGGSREAKAFLRNWITELENPVDYCTIPLDDWLKTWLKDNAKPNQEKTTYERTERLVRKNIIPFIGHIHLGALTAENVKSYYSTLLEQGKVKKIKKDNELVTIREPLSARTIKYCHVVLNQALNEAVTLEKIPKNPAKGVKPPKDKRKPKEKMNVLDAHQLTKFLKDAQLHRDYIIIFVAAYTGARQSELLGLTWDKIWWAKKAIRIDRTLHMDKESENGFEERERTKNETSTRTVIVSDKVIDLLKSCKPKGAKKKNLIFTEKDSPINRQSLSHRFERLAAKLGYPGMRFHDLRHTHATILLSDGANINEVAERLGHADPAITLSIYGHVLPGRDETLASRFDLIIEKDTEEKPEE